MKISEWMQATELSLHKAGIDTARLDSLVLLSDELERDKAWLLAHSEYDLRGSEIERLSTKVIQRTSHTPLAYIRGKIEFYGREFAVNEDVLVPRSESESMINLLKRHSENDTQITIIDIGTGSGALAITAKLELPDARVIATDIDINCLAIAAQNAAKFGVDIELIQGDLLQPIRNLKINSRNLILLCNLPYVPDNYAVNKAAKHEPSLALFGGQDGLDYYRTLSTQLQELQHHISQPRYIITEALLPQHANLTSIAKHVGYKLTDSDGLAQLFSSPTLES